MFFDCNNIICLFKMSAPSSLKSHINPDIANANQIDPDRTVQMDLDSKFPSEISVTDYDGTIYKFQVDPDGTFEMTNVTFEITTRICHKVRVSLIPNVGHISMMGGRTLAMGGIMVPVITDCGTYALYADTQYYTKVFHDGRPPENRFIKDYLNGLK